MADVDQVYRFLCAHGGRPRLVPPEWENMLGRLVVEGRARIIGSRRVCYGPHNSLRRVQVRAVPVQVGPAE